MSKSTNKDIFQAIAQIQESIKMTLTLAFHVRQDLTAMMATIFCVHALQDLTLF